MIANAASFGRTYQARDRGVGVVESESTVVRHDADLNASPDTTTRARTEAAWGAAAAAPLPPPSTPAIGRPVVTDPVQQHPRRHDRARSLIAASLGHGVALQRNQAHQRSDSSSAPDRRSGSEGRDHDLMRAARQHEHDQSPKNPRAACTRGRTSITYGLPRRNLSRSLKFRRRPCHDAWTTSTSR